MSHAKTALLIITDVEESPSLVHIVDHVRKVGAFAHRFLDSLRHCEVGLASGRLDWNMSLLSLFLKFGMSCFAEFVRQCHSLSLLSDRDNKIESRFIVEGASLKLSLDNFFSYILRQMLAFASASTSSSIYATTL